MICLLLIMTMIFINSIDSAEQKVRHSDTLLKEEEMNAKTKAWLLMVESGKVDQEELRRITPKSIFIAPLLTSRVGKCKEGYRHDHLGQCVKVIKIDPQVQLELLLEKLNKLYGGTEKKEEKEETVEHLEVSSGPLHFSLPISNSDEKVEQTTVNVKPETQSVSNTTVNTTIEEVQSVPEFIPIPLPMVYMNKTNPTDQTKEFESSGAEPLNETESYEPSMLEGSGEGQSASGDGFQEESTTPQVSILTEETDYFDVTETESTTFTEIYSTTEPPTEELNGTEAPEPPARTELQNESYQNITDFPSANNSTEILHKENVDRETVKNNLKSDRIYFPSDGDDDALRTLTKPPIHDSSSIRFPDEIPQQQIPSYHSPLDSSTKPNKYQTHSSAIPREQFWWLPKNWQIDENQHKSTLVKVWSRLPLIHDITYSYETPEGFKNPAHLKEPHRQIFFPQHRNEGLYKSSSQHPPTGRVVKPFKSSRFQDILITPRQNFRFQR